MNEGEKFKARLDEISRKKSEARRMYMKSLKDGESGRG